MKLLFYQCRSRRGLGGERERESLHRISLRRLSGRTQSLAHNGDPSIKLGFEFSFFHWTQTDLGVAGTVTTRSRVVSVAHATSVPVSAGTDICMNCPVRASILTAPDQSNCCRRIFSPWRGTRVSLLVKTGRRTVLMLSL